MDVARLGELYFSIAHIRNGSQQEIRPSPNKTPTDSSHYPILYPPRCLTHRRRRRADSRGLSRHLTPHREDIHELPRNHPLLPHGTKQTAGVGIHRMTLGCVAAADRLPPARPQTTAVVHMPGSRRHRSLDRAVGPLSLWWAAHARSSLLLPLLLLPLGVVLPCRGQQQEPTAALATAGALLGRY